MKLVVRLSSAVLLASLFIQPAVAAPWDRLFKRVEADPHKTYWLTQENGPWMVLAASFSGEGGEDQARELVLELRRDFKLEAYMFAKEFDYSGTMPGQRLNRYGRPLAVAYNRQGRFREIAVLVGNYPEDEHPDTRKGLEKVKAADPKCMQLSTEKKDYRVLGALRMFQKQSHFNLSQQFRGAEKLEEKAWRGPLSHSFVTTNPLLGDEYFAPGGLDEVVLRMNKPVKYSLLDCPGKYTVKVATFKGQVIVNPAKIRELKGKDPSDRLAEAAANANKLVTALRAKNVEAYEFHDRDSSIVTIGSFNSAGQQTPEGWQYHPAISQIMKEYGIDLVGGTGKPKHLVNIAFDLQPQVVEVPRRSISQDYNRTATRRW